MSAGLLDWLVLNYGHEQMRPGLERVRRALGPILPKFSQTTVVIIAGTNGKGETTLRLSEYLKGKKHFTWTSPHIERITERFRSEAGEIEPAELQELVDRCHREVVTQGYELSFYEFLFYVFCTWASQRVPEYLLLEVGLGGRLDAVNVFDARMVLLPSISRDHQEILGKRYEQILREKLATLRPGATLVSYLHLNYLREKTTAICRSYGAKLVDLEDTRLAEPYEFSKRNQFLAYAAYSLLNGQPIDAKKWTFSQDFLEHRGEIWKGQTDWVFFGSHNPDGMRKLIQFLHSGNYTFARPPFDHVIASFSHRSRQDLRVMLRMLRTSGLGRIIVTTFDHPKAATADLMEDLSAQEGLEFVKDIVELAKDWKGKRSVVTGSYYFLGELKSRLVRRESAAHPRG